MVSNYLFRILAVIYAFLASIASAVIMISPFGDKIVMEYIIEYTNANFFQSNRYDIMLFIIGLVFLCLNVFFLTSGIKNTRSSKYLVTENESGAVRISTTAIENVANSLSKRFQGVKDAKAKAYFKKDKVNIIVKLSVMPDVHVPNLCKLIQDRIKGSVEVTMDLEVQNISVSVDSVYTATQS